MTPATGRRLGNVTPNRVNRGNGTNAPTPNPHWQLFADWCAARGLTPLPTTPAVIADFLATVPAAASTQATRVRAIRSAHQAAGAPLPMPTAEPESCWRVGEGWLDLEETITRAPVAGWTAGLAGRRDAFLAVLVGQLGLSRERARSVTAQDIRVLPDGGLAIKGERVPYADDPVPCPACAVRRWLKILTIFDDHGRASARSYLFAYKPDGEHECGSEEAVGGLGDRPLLPAIDKYGWLGDWAPMTGRTISAILAYRQDASRELPDLNQEIKPARDEGEVREDYQRASMAELAELQDAMDARAAIALKHSDQIIADTMSMLAKVRGR